MLDLEILLPPVVAFLGLAFLLNAVMRQFRETKHEQIAFGVLFGAIVIVAMTNPIVLGEGLIFDTRTMLITAAVAFVGPLAGSIALAFGVVGRIMIGGTGTPAGIAALLIAFGIALAWSHFMRDRFKKPIQNDILLGLTSTLCLVGVFVLPFDLAKELFLGLLPAKALIHVLGIVAIGLVFRREVRHFELAKKLTSYAQTDMLTSILNRRGMDAKVRATKFDPKRGHALLYFDIDNFKHINDTYGHLAGDAALSIMAARIKDTIRDEAVFARHGGDEFSIYIPALEAEGVQNVADRVRAVITKEAFTYEDQSFPVSISIGAFWTQQEMPLQRMIDLADAQLLLAKRAGKNRAHVAYEECTQASAVA